MRILVSGATGVIGSAVCRELGARGHQIVRLTRFLAHAEAPAVEWQPAAGRLEAGALEGVEAVVHLAGEPIAEGRWTDAKKARILESRKSGTRLLATTLAALPVPPRVLVSASAVGIYGDRGDEVLTEESPPGEGFLAEVCRVWEGETEPASHAGIRVVHLRIGLVLGPAGLLARMAPTFRFGLGGRLGDGRQWMSWIHQDDVVGAVRHALETERLAGPVNAVGPAPVTNRAFTKALASVLHRPAVLPVPAFALRTALGDLADEAVLASQRVLPARLEATGYVFRHPELEPALADVLGRS